MKVPDCGERGRMTEEAHDEDDYQVPEREWARHCSGHLRSDVSGCHGGDRATNHLLL